MQVTTTVLVTGVCCMLYDSIIMLFLYDVMMDFVRSDSKYKWFNELYNDELVYL